MKATNRETLISKYEEKIVVEAEENTRRHVVKPVDRYEFQVVDDHFGG